METDVHIFKPQKSYSPHISNIYCFNDHNTQPNIYIYMVYKTAGTTVDK